MEANALTTKDIMMMNDGNSEKTHCIIIHHIEQHYNFIALDIHIPTVRMEKLLTWFWTTCDAVL